MTSLALPEDLSVPIVGDMLMQLSWTSISHNSFLWIVLIAWTSRDILHETWKAEVKQRQFLFYSQKANAQKQVLLPLICWQPPQLLLNLSPQHLTLLGQVHTSSVMKETSFSCNGPFCFVLCWDMTMELYLFYKQQLEYHGRQSRREFMSDCYLKAQQRTINNLSSGRLSFSSPHDCESIKPPDMIPRKVMAMEKVPTFAGQSLSLQSICCNQWQTLHSLEPRQQFNY